MANALLTIDMITKAALRSFRNNLGMAKSVNRQYDAEFGSKGNKIGDTLRVRKPAQYTVSDGATLAIQDHTETKVDLAIDKQKHVGLAFSQNDLKLKIEEFTARIIDPVMIPLANKVDEDLAALYKDVYNSVGTPATAITTLEKYLDGAALMHNSGCPQDPRVAVLNPLAEAKLVNGLSGLFQSSEQIAAQYEKGVMGIAAGFKFKMDQNIQSHTVGALGGTPLVNGGSQTGSTLATDGWSNSVTGLLKAGDVFTIAGVFAVNPVSKQSTGALQQFVVTADVNSNGSGVASIPISPAITTSGAFQTVSGSPADNAAITVIGSAAAVGKENLLFHPDAFTLAMVGMDVPAAGAETKVMVDKQSGIVINYASQYDITNYRSIYRFDVIYGVKTLRPEWACRART